MSCTACFRGLLSFVILVNMLIGLALVGTSVWLYLDGAELWTYLYGFNVGPVLAEIECFHYVLYSILILGALKVSLSFVGCCEVSRKFFVPVLLLFGIQIAAGVCVWYFKDDFTAESTKSLTHYVHSGYAATANATASDAAFDSLQAQYRCCGSEAPSDWSTATFNNITGDSYQVPRSCCITDLACDSSRTIKDNVVPDGTIYRSGCGDKLYGPIFRYIYRYDTLGILAGYVLIEFLVFTLKLFACRKRYADYDSNMMELKLYR
ncbi:tetraspanin-18-like [Macrobrachium nipponense]|uniref:tetraspanin-18-like n=1 Tax=Macrobrachium nipponense TaxID=159736 RepID=UPI0030C85180